MKKLITPEALTFAENKRERMRETIKLNLDQDGIYDDWLQRLADWTGPMLLDGGISETRWMGATVW